MVKEWIAKMKEAVPVLAKKYMYYFFAFLAGILVGGLFI